MSLGLRFRVWGLGFQSGRPAEPPPFSRQAAPDLPADGVRISGFKGLNYWDYMGIMEKKMEASIMGYIGYRIWLWSEIVSTMKLPCS